MSKVAQNKSESASPPQVGMISLGCAKNLVGAEVMLGSLMADGIELTNESAEAMAVQKKIARAHGKALIGQRLNVLTEKLATDQHLNGGDVRSWEHGLIRENNRKSTKLKADQYTIARGEADAPDIDGRIFVQGMLPLGDFYWVRVIGYTDYDLIAEPA